MDGKGSMWWYWIAWKIALQIENKTAAEHSLRRIARSGDGADPESYRDAADLVRQAGSACIAAGACTTTRKEERVWASELESMRAEDDARGKADAA